MFWVVWVVAPSAKRTVGNFRNAGFYHVVEIKGYSAIGCGFVSGGCKNESTPRDCALSEQEAYM